MSKSHKSAGPVLLPRPLQEGLDKAHDLIGRQLWEDAELVLDPLNRRYPRRAEVLTPMRLVFQKRGNTSRWREMTELLLELRPGDADLLFDLAGRLQDDAFPALALRWWRHFIALHPGDARLAQAKKRAAEALAAARPVMESLHGHVEDLDIAPTQIEELAAAHDEARLRNSQDRYAEARRVGRRVLDAAPEWAPALRQAAWTEWGAEKVDASLKLIERAMALHPDDIEVLALAVCLHQLSGRGEAACALSDTLRLMVPDSTEQAARKADALSVIGDYEGVLEALQEATDAEVLPAQGENPVVWQLAGEAAFRLDRFDEARAHWEQAVKISPVQLAGSMAGSNLREWDAPPEKQHEAAFPYFIFNVADRCVFHEFLESLITGAKARDFHTMRQDAHAMLRRHPTLEKLIPFYLDRGNVLMRILAVSIARDVQTPPMVDALLDFGLGRSGPDNERYDALNLAAFHKRCPTGLTTMWWQGDWREMPVTMARREKKSPRRFSPAIEKELRQCQGAMKEDRFDEAIVRLEKLCEGGKKPPELREFLFLAYTGAGRKDEAIALLLDMVASHPGYIPALQLLGAWHLETGDFAAAHAAVEPLWNMQNLSVDEFTDWFCLKARLALAEGPPESARPWLDSLKHFKFKNEDTKELREIAGLPPEEE